jgi:hypothetical protein
MTGSDDSLRSPRLSGVVVRLLKGVVHRDDDLSVWGNLLDLQSRVRDHVAVMGLDLVLDESEGYAFLHSIATDDDSGTLSIPRLVARRPLSYPVSLLLVLLRRKLAETDVAGGDTRVVVGLDDVMETLRTFLPDRRDEAGLEDKVSRNIEKIVDLGFLRQLKTTSNAKKDRRWEVRRILKAFVDAQWLADFDARLESYRLSASAQGESDA